MIQSYASDKKYKKNKKNQKNKDKTNYITDTYWKCPQCEILNKKTVLKCIACFKPIPQIDQMNNNNNNNNNKKHHQNNNNINHSNKKHKKKHNYNNNDNNSQLQQTKSNTNTQLNYNHNNDIHKSEFHESKANDNDNNQISSNIVCTECKNEEGYDIGCAHRLCIKCCTKYILDGINNMKWKSQSITCPSSHSSDNNNKCDNIIPSWLISSCNINASLIKKFDEMRNLYLIQSDPTLNLISCPKCGTSYLAEEGDNNNSSDNNIHHQHYTKYRYRCSVNKCRTIFCSKCLTIPYHRGYTCDEYKIYKQSKKCRFCETVVTKSNMSPIDPSHSCNSGLAANIVCNSSDCLNRRAYSCDIIHKCGHNCIGKKDDKCLPCFNKKCVAINSKLQIDFNEESFCGICYVDPLRAAPCIQLGCKHVFHYSCLRKQIKKKWNSSRINFNFLNCPSCKSKIHHKTLKDITKKHYKLMKKVEKIAGRIAKQENLEKDPKIQDYSNNLIKYAMDRLAFYLCSKCKQPYYGGMKACEQGLNDNNNNNNDDNNEEKYDDLICGKCSSGPNAKKCLIHGAKAITYKCRWCCSIGVWFCWGNTHFCDECHTKQENDEYLNRKPISELPKCPGKNKCPLGIPHPPNGTEFALGCSICLRK